MGFYSFSHLHSPLLKTRSVSPRTISSSIVFVYSYRYTQPLTQIPMPNHVGTFEPRLQPLMVSTQSWWSYGKIGDCEQSVILIKPYGFSVVVARVVGGCGTHGLIVAGDPFKNVGWLRSPQVCVCSKLEPQAFKGTYPLLVMSSLLGNHFMALIMRFSQGDVCLCLNQVVSITFFYHCYTQTTP